MSGTLRLARLDLPCRDLARQRDFYTRILGLKPVEEGPEGICYGLGTVAFLLRPRGDALFPSEGGPGLLLAFPVEEAELDRWHRRVLTNRVAVLDPPRPLPMGGRAVRISDPEGNVIEFYTEG
ncbi:VOC family protein [Roseomonas sp. NAR14]|uniref:VOC family protein n=1 Tax=Roseomonas acroporae TaxID=2937791 RepID=A0A9X1YAH5_9PROT|nr:VOC family protein [Roseomonas acroporae]MCK8787159.1 VOC family protein [Roseomonas acroporae]